MAITFREDVPLPEFVDDEQSARELLRLCLRKVKEDPDDFVGFDTETKGKKIPIKKKPLDPLNDHVTFWSLSFKTERYRRWCIGQRWFQMFTPFLEHPGWNIAGWNLKYDAHISWNCNVNIWNARLPVDGLAMAGLHDENRRSHGLKACAADWCGLHMTPYKSLFDGIVDAEGKKAKEYETSLVELAELGHQDVVADYASYDAYAHLMTVLWLKERLEETPRGIDSNLWDYFVEWEMPFTEMLWRMERRGLALDTEYLKSKLPDLQDRMGMLERDIARLSGRVINLNSPKQLANYFFKDDDGLKLDIVKETATGEPSTDGDVMESLVEAGVEVAERIMLWRKLDKVKSTYYDALIALSEHFEDHRIHPNFNQFGARTGRLSTNHPNSQNLPRPDGDEWGIRYAFVAPEGKKLIVADYEQIEMRIMADLSGDERMLQAILEGKDLHSYTVSVMDNVDYEEVVAAKKAKDPTPRQKWLKRQRQARKSIGFGIIYGAGPPKISQDIEITDEDILERLNSMDERTIERRMNRLMKNNPLLDEEKALILVGRHSFAGQKIQDYLDTFSGVRGFMESTPQLCRHLMKYDENNNERDWFAPGAFQEDQRGWGNAKKLSSTGHAKRFGYVETLLGRRRRLEDIDHKNYFYKSEAERQAVNTRIQGSAADITKAAMLAIEYNEELALLEVLVLNQVHDEIVMEAPEENVEFAAPIIQHLMEHPFGEVEALSVPIPVDLKVVDRWSEAK